MLGLVALYAMNAQAQTSDTTTITPGYVDTGSQVYMGLWVNPYNMGSASPSTTSNGKTYNGVIDGYQWLYDQFGQPYLAYSQSWVGVSGFTSDPGAGWLVSVRGMSTAGQGYQYQPQYGIAIWGVAGAFGASPGTPLSVTWVHY